MKRHINLLPWYRVCSCAEINNGTSVEAGKDKVEAWTPDNECEDGI